MGAAFATLGFSSTGAEAGAGTGGVGGMEESVVVDSVWFSVLHSSVPFSSRYLSMTA